jgi:hypothetical protein
MDWDPTLVSAVKVRRLIAWTMSRTDLTKLWRTLNSQLNVLLENLLGLVINHKMFARQAVLPSLCACNLGRFYGNYLPE